MKYERGEGMPEISRFHGIIVRMYFNDHVPPHLHAACGNREAEVGISPAELRSGDLPKRLLSLLFEWMALHEAEILDNWHRLHTDQAPRPIPPLP
jgi:hypothetical protein